MNAAMRTGNLRRIGPNDCDILGSLILELAVTRAG